MKHFYRIAAVLGAALLLLSGAWATPETVIPGGNTVALRLETDGVCIVEFAEDYPKNAGLRRGDLLHSIDGAEVRSAQAVAQAVAASDGRPMKLTVTRGGREKSVTVAPHETKDGWRLGIYVRDRMSGIGTVTFYDAENETFGALGHGICESGSSELLPVRSGSVLYAEVMAVTKGKSGAAGALQGAVCGRSACGEISGNTRQGVFGTMPARNAQPVPVGKASELHTGAATILSNVRGQEIREYSVQIRAIHPDEPQGRNLLLQVTDPALLEATGGIVQGMSGSPIMQDGKLVGAVTHVLIDDPTMGYGILIEAMLDAQSAQAKAA